MTIVVNPQDLNSVANAIENLAGEYAQSYAALYADVSSLQSAWKGVDNQKFTSQIEGFRNDFEKMKTLMDDYATFLKNAAENYSATQQAVTDAAGKLSTGN